MIDQELLKRLTAEVASRLRQEVLLVPVGVSVRHVHLCIDALTALFGPGYQLQPLRELQPGEFAAKETVTIVGANMHGIERVRVMGPLRSDTQMEISKTDAIALGLNPPWRASGLLDESESICLVGPHGSVYLRKGVILARRHIHMPADVAQQWGLTNNQEVPVYAETERPVLFKEVQIRVSQKFRLEMHVDTDDANAAGLKNGSIVRVLTGTGGVISNRG